MMKKRSVGAKWVKWVVLVVVVAVLAAFAWPTISSMIGGSTRSSRQTTSTSGSTGSAGRSSSSSSVSAGSYSTVKKGDLQVTVYGSGSLEPASTKEVYNEAEGTVESIGVEVGDTVKAGDTLLKLSSTDLETEISTLQSDLFNAQLR